MAIYTNISYCQMIDLHEKHVKHAEGISNNISVVEMPEMNGWSQKKMVKLFRQ